MEISCRRATLMVSWLFYLEWKIKPNPGMKATNAICKEEGVSFEQTTCSSLKTRGNLHRRHLLSSSLCQNGIIRLNNEIQFPLLTVAVDALDLRQLRTSAARPAVIRNAFIQAQQLPVVTTGLITRHGLHQVRAVPRAPRRLVGDPSLPQFETWNSSKGK